mgnify:CR=1 FL=1
MAYRRRAGAPGAVKTSLAALAVLVAALLATGYYLLVRMTRPLLRLRNAMTRIAEGRYDTEVKHTDRRDEIGQMAQRLDELRSALAAARGCRVGTPYRGPGLPGAPAGGGPGGARPPPPGGAAAGPRPPARAPLSAPCAPRAASRGGAAAVAGGSGRMAS